MSLNVKAYFVVTRETEKSVMCRIGNEKYNAEHDIAVWMPKSKFDNDIKAGDYGVLEGNWYANQGNNYSLEIWVNNFTKKGNNPKVIEATAKSKKSVNDDGFIDDDLPF